MLTTELLIIGGGPAGLMAAKTALEAGVKVTLIDRNHQLGGQLVKQTHKFFGSEKQYAKTRGFAIAQKLMLDLEQYRDRLTVLLDTTAVGLYSDRVVTMASGDLYEKIRPEAIIIATGAYEKFLAFENNDLPGIYGAGAVQTLMNLYGVLPGKEIIMVGSGNIGLIVSYQLIQAGVKVKAVLEASPEIGGYKVHASKLRRLGVPILTSTTVKRALGSSEIEKIVTVKLDPQWQPIEGTEAEIYVDGLCIAVGLTPMHQLLSMADIEMCYIPELGGLVPIVSEDYETSMDFVFVAGDVTGVEEASSAIVEGSLSGLMAAKKLNHLHPEFDRIRCEYRNQLDILRCGPCGCKIRSGLKKLKESPHVE